MANGPGDNRPEVLNREQVPFQPVYFYGADKVRWIIEPFLGS